jgi:hypothetical protein
VDHVHVRAGGQAIVGAVETGGGVAGKSEGQPHAKAISHAPVAPLWGETRSEKPGRAPAMPNGKCRMHGGTSPGAPTAGLTIGRPWGISAADMQEAALGSAGEASAPILGAKEPGEQLLQQVHISTALLARAESDRLQARSEARRGPIQEGSRL